MKGRRCLGILMAAAMAGSLCGCGFMGLSTDGIQKQPAAEAETETETTVTAEAIHLEEEAPAAMGFYVLHGDTEERVGPEEEPAVEDSISEDSISENAVSENSAVEAAAAPPDGVTSYELAALRNMKYSEEQMAQIRAFYQDTVFAGDSVLLGFRNYAGRSSDPLLKQLQFLAAGSLSLHNAFWPVSDKSVHPLYQGEQHPVWESIQMMGAKKAFLFFGINDVSLGLQDSIDLYPQLIAKIKELSPEVEITIISATYTLKDQGTKGLNNKNLAAFNAAIQEQAKQNGWGYIDMATVLSDGEGNLEAKYCSDGFLHETAAAYEVWTMMLVRYAADRLGYEIPDMDEIMQEPPEAAPSEETQETAGGETPAGETGETPSQAAQETGEAAAQ
ncbi:MAG: hypothetical protein IJ600_02495 [Lachnospiraceae bacterium]|nr:hypothetical protein [Lachnospiraceae bacterium]